MLVLSQRIVLIQCTVFIQCIVLWSCLLALPVSAQEWLVRLSADLYLQQYSHINPLYEFKNQDRLLKVDDSEFGISELMSLPVEQIAYIQPDIALDPIKREQTFKTQSSDSSSNQDGLAIAGFSELSDSARQCDQVTIAVIDSGFDSTHPYLSHVELKDPYDVILETESITDVFGHGTHVAGIIAAESEGSVSGACTSASLMPIRFLNSTGGGSVSDAITGVQWAIDHDARIINHSWTVSRFSQSLQDVVEDADSRGIIQISAAGNQSSSLDDLDIYPAKFAEQLPGMFAIANWDNSIETLNTNSNYGWAHVDLAAPGTDILSLAVGGGTRLESGSSMAVPYVSGAVAMLWQQQPDWSSHAVLASLLQKSEVVDSLQGKTRGGRNLDVTDMQQATAPEAQILSLDRGDTSITLEGYSLDVISELRYRSAVVGQEEESETLTVASASSTSLEIDNWDMPAGWFEWKNEQGEWLSWAYLPSVPSPIEVVHQTMDSGNLITWQGSDYATEYNIYRSDEGSYNQRIATVSGPGNQYLDADGTSTSSYRIRLSYDIEIAEQQYQLDSELSETSDNNGYSEQISIDTIPVNTEVRIPLFLDEESVQMVVVSASHDWVEEINGNFVTIDTSEERSGTLTLLNEETNSLQTLWLEVVDAENWTLESDSSNLIFDAVDSQIYSVQQTSSDRIVISGQWQANSSAIQIRLADDDGDYFEQASIESMDSEAQVSLINRGSSISLTAAATMEQQEQSFTIILAIDVGSEALPGSERDDTRCFLATAVYSGEQHKLVFFRTLRDDYLLPIPGGKWLVSQYYKWSPRLVAFSDMYPWVKVAIKTILDGIYSSNLKMQDSELHQRVQAI